MQRLLLIIIYSSRGTSLLENSRFPRNIDIPQNIRAKLGGSPEYWRESRIIVGISEGVGCFKIIIKSPKEIEKRTLDQFSLLDIHEDGYFFKTLY